MRARTTLIGAAAIVATALAVMGVRTAWSYLRTSQRVVQKGIEDSTPLEFHLERLRQMVDDLAPEVRRNRTLLAEAEVDVEHLQIEVAQQQGKLTQSRDQIIRQRKLLSNSDSDLFIGGHKYTRQQVETDLAEKLDAYSATEATLQAKQHLLDARREVVDSSRKKLQSYQRQNQQLDVQVAQLDSQLRLVESREGPHKLEFNHSKLAEAQRLADYVKRKLDVAQRVLEDSSVAEDGIPDEYLTNRDVMREVDAKFGEPAVAKHQLDIPLTD